MTTVWDTIEEARGLIESAEADEDMCVESEIHWTVTAEILKQRDEFMLLVIDSVFSVTADMRDDVDFRAHRLLDKYGVRSREDATNLVVFGDVKGGVLPDYKE